MCYAMLVDISTTQSYFAKFAYIQYWVVLVYQFNIMLYKPV